MGSNRLSHVSGARRARVAVVVALATAGGLAGCGSRIPDPQLRASAGLSAAGPAAATAATADAGGPDLSAAAAPAYGVTGAPAAPTASDGSSAAPGVSTPVAGRSALAAGSSAGPVGATTGAAPARGATAAAVPNAAAAPREEAGSPAPNASGGGACPPSCVPIIIGSVGTYSGIIGQTVAGGMQGVQAWAASVNAKGGLKGHPVQLLVADDGGDPARDRSLVQQFVEQRHVIAFVYNAAPLSGQVSVDYLDKARIPVVGSEGGSDWFYQSPMFFPQHTSGRELILTPVGSAAVSMLPQGKKKLGMIYCSDGIQVCEDAKTTVPKEAPKYGFTYVYTGSASLAQPDFTANCLAARDAGAEMLLMTMDRNSIHRIARSCLNVGYKPTLVISQTTENDDMANDPNLDGSVGTGLVAPWFDTANPAVAEYRQIMAQFAPRVDPSGIAVQGWAAAKVFEKAAAFITNPPTSESILQGLWSLHNETLGGLVPPVNFTKDQTAPRYVCFWALLIKDKKFVKADDGSVHCR